MKMGRNSFSDKRQLRICLVLETSGGGSGRHVLDLAEGLHNSGHTVTILWSPVRAAEDWRERLQSLTGIRSVPVPMNRSIGWQDLEARLALKSKIDQAGPFDIIHGHSSKAGALVRLLPDTIPGKRVYTPHAYAFMNPESPQVKRWFFRQVERFLSRQTYATIVVSQKEMIAAKTAGIRGPITRVVNGMSKPIFENRAKVRQSFGLGPDQLAVGFVGRFSYQKNPERFIQIIRHARHLNSNICGVMIGEGPLRQQLEILSNDLDLGIVFTGWRDAPPILCGLDAFLMTSRYEAMPYTFLEALNAGLPIFSLDVGGTEETIISLENGQIFPQSTDDQRIGRAISDLLSNPKQRARYQTVSRELAGKYSLEAMTGETTALYEALLS